MDDLRDAPVELPSGQLLHSLDPDCEALSLSLGHSRAGTRRGFEGCLRQIGTDANRSSGMLKYLVRHYRDVVGQLGERGAQGIDDLRELEALRQTADGVPCLDAAWYPATECVDASQLRSLLMSQGFKGAHLDELLCKLSYPRPVADTSSDVGQMALGFWNITKLDRDSVVELAITSENGNLPFSDRIRVIAANLNLLPEAPPARATVMDNEICEAMGGPAKLSKLVLVGTKAIGLSKEVIATVLPEAADLAHLATKFTEAGQQLWCGLARSSVSEPSTWRNFIHALQPTLRPFGQPSVPAPVSNCSRGWRRTATQNSLGDFPKLDIVLVGAANGTWVPPSGVIAPSWASATLPTVPAGSIPRTA